MFKVRKSTGNVTDVDEIVIHDAELPTTVTVWDATVFDGQKLLAAVTIDVNSVQIWGPDGSEIAHWYRREAHADA